MRKLEKNELEKISGGLSAWAIAGLTALGVFLAGLIDGIARPLKCHK